MYKDLTDKQLKVFTYIKEHIDNEGCAPTYSEICEEFEISNGSVTQYLRALEKKKIYRALAGNTARDLRYKTRTTHNETH